MADSAEPDAAGRAVSLYDGYSTLARALGQVVAPTAVVSGLLFYFGYFHAYYFCNYFGINSTILGMSNRDFVMRSADGLFVPMGVIATVGLAALWGIVAVPDRIKNAARPPWLSWVVLTVAAALLVNGLSRLFVVTPLNRGLCIAPSSIIVGLLILWWAVVERRRTTGASSPGVLLESLVVVILVGGSLFWIANDYSVAVGESRARQFETEIPTLPTAVVFSERDLHLDGAGVHKSLCAGGSEGTAYNYRYDGLVLVMKAGDNLVLLPRTWSSGAGAAVVLPETGVGSLRLEFVRAGSTDPLVC